MIISQIEYQVGNTGLTETTENGVETIVVIGDKISVKKITNFLSSCFINAIVEHRIGLNCFRGDSYNPVLNHRATRKFIHRKRGGIGTVKQGVVLLCNCISVYFSNNIFPLQPGSRCRCIWKYIFDNGVIFRAGFIGSCKSQGESESLWFTGKIGQ